MGYGSRSRSRDGGRSKRRGRETGTVNTWNNEKQFGFVSCTSSNRADLFLHAEYFEDLDQRYKAKNRGLRRGDKVEFDVEEPQAGKKSAQAINAELIETVGRSPSGSRSPDRGRPPPRAKNVEFRPGDWDCTRCDFHNFARNTDCMKCGARKSGGGLGRGRSRSKDSRRKSPARRSRSRRRSRRRSPSRGSQSRSRSPSRRRRDRSRGRS